MDCADDFGAHLNQRLKDPKKAALFLATCLHDALEDGDILHFSDAIQAVGKAIGKRDPKQIYKAVAPHLRSNPNFHEDISIVLFRIASVKSGAKQARLVQAA